MQTTLIILKPDTVQRGLMGRVISRFEDKGFQIVGCRLVHIGRDVVAKHYEVHKDKPFYQNVVRYVSSGPSLVMAIRGKNAIAICRKMMGATFGSDAVPGTIRGDFSLSDSFNLIHGSDSEETAKQELELFFKGEALLDYERTLERWVYDLSGDRPE